MRKGTQDDHYYRNRKLLGERARDRCIHTVPHDENTELFQFVMGWIVAVAVCDGVPVRELDGVCVRLDDGVMVRDADGVRVREPEGVAVRDGDDVLVDVSVPRGIAFPQVDSKTIKNSEIQNASVLTRQASRFRCMFEFRSRCQPDE